MKSVDCRIISMKSVSMLGKLHECPDGKHNSDDEHSDEES